MKLDLGTVLSGLSVADGGWSTLLAARGLPEGRIPETANLSHPQLIVSLAREYLQAGARFICTNTFACNRLALETRKVRASVGDLNRAAVTLLRDAVGESAFVVGAMGPSGKILAVRETTDQKVIEAFSEQALVLSEAGVDLLLLETFSELTEAGLALQAARAVSTLPIIVSFSFDSGPQRTRTMMGDEAAACAAAMDSAGADMIGCNCGAGIAHTLPAVVALRANTVRPLWVKPSVGVPELEGGRPVYRLPVDEFAAHIPTLLDAGANVIGGCCGVGPEHIRRIAALVDSRNRAARRAPK